MQTSRQVALTLRGVCHVQVLRCVGLQFLSFVPSQVNGLEDLFATFCSGILNVLDTANITAVQVNGDIKFVVLRAFLKLLFCYDKLLKWQFHQLKYESDNIVCLSRQIISIFLAFWELGAYLNVELLLQLGSWITGSYDKPPSINSVLYLSSPEPHLQWPCAYQMNQQQSWIVIFVTCFRKMLIMLALAHPECCPYLLVISLALLTIAYYPSKFLKMSSCCRVELEP